MSCEHEVTAMPFQPTVHASVSPFVLAFGLLVPPGTAQNVKLNAPLAREVAGFVSGPVTSSDGKTLVYVAGRDGGPEFQLYAVAPDGKGDPIRLSGALGQHGELQTTVDGKAALLVADLDANDFADLSVVPLDGSAPPSILSGRGVHGGVVWLLQQSKDGLHALYLAGSERNLYSVRVDGSGAPVRLNGALVPGGYVRDYSLSEDGRLVLYSANQDAQERVELFVAPVDGSSPARKLPIPLVPGGNVFAFRFDPAASDILYTADQEEDERQELFTVRTDGSQPPRKLNGPLVPGGDVGPRFQPTFHLSPDGHRVVYLADQDVDERFELYSVPSDGSAAPVKLSTPSDQGPTVRAISHDSAWVIYFSDPSFTGTYEIFSVPIDGAAPSRRLNGPMAPGGDASFPVVSHDSRRVVYAADQDVNDVHELFSAPIDGSALPVKLSAPMPPGGDLSEHPGYRPGFEVMEDGVMYVADQEVDGIVELYFAPLAGGSAPRKLAAGPLSSAYPSATDLSAPPDDFGRVLFFRQRSLFSVAIEPGAVPILLDEPTASVTVGDVGDFLLSSSGERVVYRAREEGDGELGELHSVRTSKPPEHVRLRSGLPAGASATALFFTPDERRVIYATPAPITSTFDLHIEPVDGSAPPIQLNPFPAGGVSGGFAGGFERVRLLPDGLRLAFFARAGDPARFGLFVTPLDASSPPLLVSADLDLLPVLEVSADGSRLALSSTEIPRRLYVVPADGSEPPLRVETPGLRPFDFRLSQDGQRIFFRSSSPARVDLFMAPSDASAAPLQLSAPLHARASVMAFAVDPLGLWVVYRADQEVDEQFELYSVPADGSAAPRRLHAALSGARDVDDFQIAAGTRRVAFRGDLRTNEVLELFSAPLDAGRAPVRLSVDLASSADVLNYRVSPDGERVVYRAGEFSPTPVELFSAPIRGSRGQVKLSRPLFPGGHVVTYAISADSRTVVFTAQRLATAGPILGRPLTLMAAPIGGADKAREIAGPFHGDGSVVNFQIGADGCAVYAADQDEQGSFELYAARRAPAPAVPAASRR